MSLPDYCDVLVVGSGNAGFSAALAAKESGAQSVLVIDKCPESWAGGNSYFTAGAYRTVHAGTSDLLPLVNNVDAALAQKIDIEPYTISHFQSDMHRVCAGRSDPALATTLVENSNAAIKWLAKNGIRFQLSFNRQAYEVDGRFKFWGGLALKTEDGGKGLISDFKKAARRVGVTVFYSTALKQLIAPGGVVTGVAGNWSGCHSVAWDADAPFHAGDQATSNEFTKSGYPLGLMLNTKGERFVDEGVDLRNYTYAKFGRAILGQPSQAAYQVWDAKAIPWLREEEYRPERVKRIIASSIEELARKLAADEGLEDASTFVTTLADYNEAVYAHRKENPGCKWDPAIRDGLSTQSRTHQLALAKSNWALPLDQAPFMAVKVTCGITFTFGGLSVVPETAQVVSATTDKGIPRLYCVGEMLGGLFFENYPGGSGLTSGAVFGRKAGAAAAADAAQQAGRFARASL
ncbi:FAD binding domain containing protein [Cladophialophora carrionii]|uniref:FAD binding domain containing protein n=1 Tax=Cladophialophora carrionii TaxID=86049 RepID=A0A1C1CTD8_9EURO|nr:FAD binding domain containing protein [Cladophialophora carrionii]